MNPDNHHFFELFKSLCKPGQDPSVLALTFDEVEDPSDKAVNALAAELHQVTAYETQHALSPIMRDHPSHRAHELMEKITGLTNKPPTNPSELLRDIQLCASTLTELGVHEQPGIPIYADRLLKIIATPPDTITIHLEHNPTFLSPTTQEHPDHYVDITLSMPPRSSGHVFDRKSNPVLNKIAGRIRDLLMETQRVDTSCFRYTNVSTTRTDGIEINVWFPNYAATTLATIRTAAEKAVTEQGLKPVLHQ